LSNKWCHWSSLWLKILLFTSFQITHPQANQTWYKKDRKVLENPPICPNCKKWSDTRDQSTEKKILIQVWIRVQRSLKWLQHKKKIWSIISCIPQQLTQRLESGWRIPQLIKLSLVGSRFRKTHHTKTETFKGTFLCQISAIKG
jgi:hypothetical protein